MVWMAWHFDLLGGMEPLSPSAYYQGLPFCCVGGLTDGSFVSINRIHTTPFFVLGQILPRRKKEKSPPPCLFLGCGSKGPKQMCVGRANELETGYLLERVDGYRSGQTPTLLPPGVGCCSRYGVMEAWAETTASHQDIQSTVLYT